MNRVWRYLTWKQFHLSWWDVAKLWILGVVMVALSNAIAR